MRKVFGTSRGELLEELACRSTSEHPRLAIAAPTGIITDSPTGVVEALRRDGLVVLDSRLSEQDCAALTDLAVEAECTLTDREPGAPEKGRFASDAPLAVRYDVPESTLVDAAVVQRLLVDRSVLAIAQDYLGGAPVQDLVAMWWTAASMRSSSEAAQQFHFDLDRLRFLKLFIYLTDVGPANGPHVFVRGSHRALPAPLRGDRRFSDDEVLQHFDEADIVTITGARGAMFLADTRGLHKGVNVVAGHRLVFQLEYATSLFGAAAPRLSVDQPTPDLSSAVSDFPMAYRRFDLTS